MDPPDPPFIILYPSWFEKEVGEGNEDGLANEGEKDEEAEAGPELP